LIIDALEFVLDDNRRPAVVNMSLGGRYVSGAQAFERAVQRVIDAGVTVVAGAGNSNENACNYTPARIPDVITVGASDRSDNKANFSNHGPCIDIVAPGVNIFSSAVRNQSNLPSCADDDGDGYANCSGTSMASPHVAGIVAHFLESHKGASPAGVSTAMISAATRGALSNLTVSTANRLSHSQHLSNVTQPDIVAVVYVDSNKMTCA
jgi:subtilisin family serine protease